MFSRHTTQLSQHFRTLPTIRDLHASSLWSNKYWPFHHSSELDRTEVEITDQFTQQAPQRQWWRLLSGTPSPIQWQTSLTMDQAKKTQLRHWTNQCAVHTTRAQMVIDQFGAWTTLNMGMMSGSIPIPQLGAITIPSLYNWHSDLTPECCNIKIQKPISETMYEFAQ